MDALKALAASPVFAHLQHSQLVELARRGTERTYGRGEWIAHCAEVWPFLFLIGAGHVQAVKESIEGRSLVLTTLGTGDIFWGLAFFVEEAEMPAALLAPEGCELFLWTRERVLPFLLQDGRSAWELSRQMIQRVQLASDIVERLAFQPVAGRLAAFLLQNYGQDDSGPVARDLTLDEIAAHIGSTREVVSRFLHRFSDQGMIEITRTEFAIKDRSGLRTISRQSKG